MNIEKIINKLNLLYYEFDEKNKELVLDTNYSNRFTKLEFAKITYHLSKMNIPFSVQKKGQIIQIDMEKVNIYQKLISYLRKIRLKKENIFVLNDKKVKFAQNLPLLKIKYLKKDIDLSKYDYLIFTSKNAVKAINSFNKTWKKIPALAISHQTAKVIKDLEGNVDFIGKSSHGDEFAQEIKEKIANKKVLYLRSDKIVSNLIDILNCDDIIVYENCFNDIKNKYKLPKKSKIIFSSPSTISYFLKQYTWDNSYTAISIGKTTAKYFPKYINPIIADKTSLKACVKKALELR
jgi:uroporphyrinogen-III synthase